MAKSLNIMKIIANIFNVKINEEFHVEDETGAISYHPYKFTEDDFVVILQNKYMTSGGTLVRLLSGKYVITKRSPSSQDTYFIGDL